MDPKLVFVVVSTIIAAFLGALYGVFLLLMRTKIANKLVDKLLGENFEPYENSEIERSQKD